LAQSLDCCPVTGVGGGIFLSPLLLLFRWADIRSTAGVSAAFILVNSASALLGHFESVKALPTKYLVGAGSASGRSDRFKTGSRKLTPVVMRRLLRQCWWSPD